MGVFIEGSNSDSDLDTSWQPVADMVGPVAATSVTIAKLTGLVTGVLIYWNARTDKACIPSSHSLAIVL